MAEENKGRKRIADEYGFIRERMEQIEKEKLAAEIAKSLRSSPTTALPAKYSCIHCWDVGFTKTGSGKWFTCKVCGNPKKNKMP